MTTIASTSDVEGLINSVAANIKYIFSPIFDVFSRFQLLQAKSARLRSGCVDSHMDDGIPEPRLEASFAYPVQSEASCQRKVWAQAINRPLTTLPHGALLLRRLRTCLEKTTSSFFLHSYYFCNSCTLEQWGVLLRWGENATLFHGPHATSSKDRFGFFLADFGPVSLWAASQRASDCRATPAQKRTC